MYSRRFLNDYPTGEPDTPEARRQADRAWTRIVEMLEKLNRAFYNSGLTIHACASVENGQVVLYIYRNTDQHRPVFRLAEKPTVRQMETFIRRYMSEWDDLKAHGRLEERIAEMATRADVALIAQPEPSQPPPKPQRSNPQDDLSWLLGND